MLTLLLNQLSTGKFRTSGPESKERSMSCEEGLHVTFRSVRQFGLRIRKPLTTIIRQHLLFRSERVRGGSFCAETLSWDDRWIRSRCGSLRFAVEQRNDKTLWRIACVNRRLPGRHRKFAAVCVGSIEAD